MADVLPPDTHISSDSVVDRLYSLVIPASSAHRAIRRFSLLYADGSRVVRDREPKSALLALESDIALFVALQSPRFVFVHAGVVAWKGRAILLPARSGSGKTRMVEALVRSGATYYSDEFAVLDRTGRVRPYARPLRLREDRHDLPCRARALGAPVGSGPIPVGLIAATKYQPNSSFLPRRLTAAEAALQLISNTLAIRRYPRRGLATLRAAVANAAGLEGARGEADGAVSRLLEATDRAAGEPAKVCDNFLLGG